MGGTSGSGWPRPRAPRRVRRSLLVAVALAVMAAGTGVGPAAVGSGATRPRVLHPSAARPRQRAAAGTTATADWTYLVFANGDNNLENSLLTQIDQMTRAADSPNVHVVVLLDRIKGNYEGSFLGAPATTKAQLLEVRHGGVKVIEDVGEVDMGKGDTLAWFIQEGATRFPARHYALSIMDHGGAWLGASEDDGPPATGPQDSSLMFVKPLADALRRGERAAGIGKLDLLVYAACLMSNYEVALEMRPYAKLMVADEEEALSSLFQQDDLVRAMAGGATPDALGRLFVDSYAKVIRGQSKADQDAQAFALIDLDGMDRVRRAMGSLRRALIDNMATVAPALARARAEALTYGSLDGAAKNSFQVVDIGDLLRRLGDVGLPADVAAARGAVFTAIKSVNRYQVLGAANKQATGLTIYFPSDFGAASRAFAGYKKLIGTDDWAPVLDAYQAATASGAAPLELASGPRFAHLGADGALLEGTVSAATEAALAGAKGLWGIVGADGTPKIFVSGPAVIDAGTKGTIQATWAYSYVRLSDGKTTVPGTLYLQQQAGAIRGQIPVVYRTADGKETDAAVSLSLDANLNPSFGGLFQFGQGGGVSELTPAPGSVIVPELKSVVNGSFSLVPVPGGELPATAALTAVKARIPSATRLVAYLQLVGADGTSRASGVRAIVP
ncbi:MAG: hypothetical protein JWM05_3353 [Acidimicrobiales bacterium]|nr:hypothetical protein [Acidimicrobiales bacterium]